MSCHNKSDKELKCMVVPGKASNILVDKHSELVHCNLLIMF